MKGQITQLTVKFIIDMIDAIPNHILFNTYVLDYNKLVFIIENHIDRPDLKFKINNIIKFLDKYKEAQKRYYDRKDT